MVSLPPELLGLLDAKVASGRYATPSEVVQDALRLLDRVDREGAAGLRAAWHDGICSGDAGPPDFAAMRAEASRDAAGPSTA